MLLFCVETESHSSPILIKHTLIVEEAAAVEKRDKGRRSTAAEEMERDRGVGEKGGGECAVIVIENTARTWKNCGGQKSTLLPDGLNPIPG